MVKKKPPVNAGDTTLIPWVEKEMATHSSILAWKSHRGAW